MSLEIYRLMASMMSDGDLVVVTGRRKPYPSPTNEFPCLAYVEKKDGDLLGCLPASRFGCAFLLTQKSSDKGYHWRLPRISDAKLFEETKLIPFPASDPLL